LELGFEVEIFIVAERNLKERKFDRVSGKEKDAFEDRIVQVNRVAKKTKGGNKIGFSVLVVCGDREGRVGVGLGKGADVASGMAKASRRARKNLISVSITNAKSIPMDIYVKKGAAKVLLKPAPEGSGIAAGGPVRAIVELAGIKNISSKILGSNNRANNVYATLEALKQISSRDKVSRDLVSKGTKSPKLEVPNSKNLNRREKKAKIQLKI